MFTCEVIVQQHGAVVSNHAQWHAKVQRLPCGLLNESDDSDPSSGFLSKNVQNQSDENIRRPVLDVIKVAAKKNVFLSSALNFIILGRQLTIKSVKFWQLLFTKIWQLIGFLKTLFTVPFY